MAKSPCIRNCCLNKEDVCIGCFRHIDEIVGWNNFPEEKKEAVLAISENRKAGIKQEQFSIEVFKNQPS